jgi:ATP-dependent exoDNAse (exonuclease V) beta subunit
LQDAAAALDFQSFVWEALEAACVFLRMYSQGAEYPAIESVLERVYAIVEELLSKCEAGVNAFIEHLEVLTDMEKRSAIGEPTLPDGRVAVMTIHQAKGLEFSAVAVPGLKAKTDRAPAFYVSKEKGLFLEGFEGRGFDAFEEAVRHAENMSQEERCLVYVAMTRARDHLFLSTPKAMKERRKSGRDFFSDIMESLAAGGIPYVEWRRAPDVEEPRTVREEKVRRAAGDGEETGEAELKRWRAGRTAVRETDLQEAEPLRAVRYADWRALRTFSECPLQYYFRFVRGLPGVPEGEREPPLEPSGVPGESRWERRAAIKGVSGVDDATYGSFVHFVLQRLSARRPDGAKSVADDGKPAAGDNRRIAETIEECAGLFGLSAASTRDALKRMPGLIRRALGASSGGDGPVDERMCEQPFSIRTGEFLFTGIIDRIDRSGGRYRIVDYKTGEAKDEHRFQVQYYAWALSAVLGAEVVEGSLVYIGKECRVVEVDTSAEQIARVEASVREFERAAVERRYDAAPGGVCPGCPYGPVCPRSPSVGIRT